MGWVFFHFHPVLRPCISISKKLKTIQLPERCTRDQMQLESRWVIETMFHARLTSLLIHHWVHQLGRLIQKWGSTSYYSVPPSVIIKASNLYRFGNTQQRLLLQSGGPWYHSLLRGCFSVWPQPHPLWTYQPLCTTCWNIQQFQINWLRNLQNSPKMLTKRLFWNVGQIEACTKNIHSVLLTAYETSCSLRRIEKTRSIP